jgi:hypothetical protein
MKRSQLSPIGGPVRDEEAVAGGLYNATAMSGDRGIDQFSAVH